MSKEQYIAAHEQLVDEYLEAHPNADWAEAYDATAGAAWKCCQGDLAGHEQTMRDLAGFWGDAGRNP